MQLKPLHLSSERVSRSDGGHSLSPRRTTFLIWQVNSDTLMLAFLTSHHAPPQHTSNEPHGTSPPTARPPSAEPPGFACQSAALRHTGVC